MIHSQLVECDTYKRKISRLAFQGNASIDSLSRLLKVRPNDCSRKVQAWLGLADVKALRLFELNSEVLLLADSLLRHQWMFYDERTMSTLTAYKGNALFYLGRFEEARFPMESARRHYRKKKNFDPVTMANLDHNLAAVEMVLGDSLSAVCRLTYAETIIRLAGDTRHLRTLLEAINLAQARLAAFGVVNTDRVCLLGEIRRRPANDDNQSQIFLIILIVLVVVGALMLAHALQR